MKLGNSITVVFMIKISRYSIFPSIWKFWIDHLNRGHFLPSSQIPDGFSVQPNSKTHFTFRQKLRTAVLVPKLRSSRKNYTNSLHAKNVSWDVFHSTNSFFTLIANNCANWLLFQATLSGEELYAQTCFFIFANRYICRIFDGGLMIA